MILFFKAPGPRIKSAFGTIFSSELWKRSLSLNRIIGCRKCGQGHSCGGTAAMSRQCTSCRYEESPTAGTLFHQVKFDLVKAFWIVYFIATNKKGITSTELSRKLGLRQKTCWAFKRKVMIAIKSSGNHPITGTAEVNEIGFEGQEKGVRGRKNIRRDLVVVGLPEEKEWSL